MLIGAALCDVTVTGPIRSVVGGAQLSVFVSTLETATALLLCQGVIASGSLEAIF